MSARKQVYYRLGNIIDAWYGQEHVDERRESSLESLTCNSFGTFGNFLTTVKPVELIPEDKLTATFKQTAADWWWCYHYDNYKDAYPYFNTSLRNAIDLYFPTKPVFPEKTCVIHYRVGDFLYKCIHEGVLDLHSLVDAISLFSSTPQHFEILNGGMYHRADVLVLYTSYELLMSLKKAIHDKYPNATIAVTDSDNADTDFLKMVEAPMLLTGPGSFAILAAAANKNERLTPAIKNLISPEQGASEYTEIYENWKTYKIRTRSTGEVSNALAYNVRIQ